VCGIDLIDWQLEAGVIFPQQSCAQTMQWL